MPLKKIHEQIQELVKLLLEKVKDEKSEDIPEKNKEYSKGQLFEAQYILSMVEEIIYSNKQ